MYSFVSSPLATRRVEISRTSAELRSPVTVAAYSDAQCGDIESLSVVADGCLSSDEDQIGSLNVRSIAATTGTVVSRVSGIAIDYGSTSTNTGNMSSTEMGTGAPTTAPTAVESPSSMSTPGLQSYPTSGAAGVGWIIEAAIKALMAVGSVEVALGMI